jgi:hypothetical protein
MGDSDDDREHGESEARSIDEIAQRLVEMQRELDARPPVHPHSGDEHEEDERAPARSRDGR